MQSQASQDIPYAVVVDDNPVILLHVMDILSDAGFSVFAAADSATAMDWLAEHDDRIVLLFTNVDIPGPLDGFGLAQFAASLWKGLAIIASSGHVDLQAGDLPDRAVFVPKPFTEAQLLAAVRKALVVKPAMRLNLAGTAEPIGADDDRTRPNAAEFRLSEARDG